MDASVIIAGLIEDGTVRDTLLNADEVAFSAPSYLSEKVSSHTDRVASRARLPLATVAAVLEDLLGSIELVPPGAYSAWMATARILARRADARGDEEYIALALALDAPIWSLDKDFLRVRGLRVLSTRDVGSG